MKYSSLSVLFAALSLFLSLLSQTAQADFPVGTVQDFSWSAPANGKIIAFDLDGDGKKENVSLVSLWQSKDGLRSAYRLKVNDEILDDYWLENDLAGNVKVEGLMFGDLNVRDRSKEIVLGGPASDDTSFRIYAWRGGKIRRVLRQPILIERFNGDGTITELKYYGWAQVRLTHRLNDRGELELVRRSSYPLCVYGSSGQPKPTRVLKSVFFHLKPDARSLAFEVKKGGTVVFDRTNEKGWAGATYNGRLGWISEAQVNGDTGTFDLIKAG